MTLLSVRHVTTYRYRRPVSFGEHRIMFRPRDSYDQKLLEATLVTLPEASDLRWLHDAAGNCVAIARFAGRAEELRFETPTPTRRSIAGCAASSTVRARPTPPGC